MPRSSRRWILPKRSGLIARRLSATSARSAPMFVSSKPPPKPARACKNGSTTWPASGQRVRPDCRRCTVTATKAARPSPDGTADVEVYLAKVPEPARTTLEKLRATIRAAAPKDTSEEINYGMPAFRYKGGLVGYAAFKHHCSFFPMSASLLDEFADELKGYRTSKGTLQFPQDKPLPAALVKKMVKARVLQNEAKNARRK